MKKIKEKKREMSRTYDHPSVNEIKFNLKEDILMETRQEKAYNQMRESDRGPIINIKANLKTLNVLKNSKINKKGIIRYSN